MDAELGPRVSDYLAPAEPPAIVFEDNRLQPILYSWDLTGSPAEEPATIAWDDVPIVNPETSNLEILLESENPPERVVFLTYPQVDQNGIPLGEGNETLCTFGDVTSCQLLFNSNNRLLDIDLQNLDGDARFAIAQLTWLEAPSGNVVPEVWATWGFKIDG